MVYKNSNKKILILTILIAVEFSFQQGLQATSNSTNASISQINNTINSTSNNNIEIKRTEIRSNNTNNFIANFQNNIDETNYCFNLNPQSSIDCPLNIYKYIICCYLEFYTPYTGKSCTAMTPNILGRNYTNFQITLLTNKTINGSLYCHGEKFNLNLITYFIFLFFVL